MLVLVLVKNKCCPAAILTSRKLWFSCTAEHDGYSVPSGRGRIERTAKDSSCFLKHETKLFRRVELSTFYTLDLGGGVRRFRVSGFKCGHLGAAARVQGDGVLVRFGVDVAILSRNALRKQCER